MDIRITFGELLTILGLVGHGVAFWVTFDRRMTVLEQRIPEKLKERLVTVEERVDVLRSNCPLLHAQSQQHHQHGGD